MNKPISQLDLIPAEPVEAKPTTAAPANISAACDTIVPKRWRHDDPDLIVQCQPAICVYENMYGSVVILQEQQGHEDDDQCVMIRPENLSVIISALKKYLP